MNQIRSTGSAVLLLGALLFVPGCRESPTGPINNLVVQTSQPVYDVSSDASAFRISATVTNTLNRTLLIDWLGRDYDRLEKRIDGEWQTVFVPMYTLEGRRDIRLEPGQTQNLTFTAGVGYMSIPNLEPYRRVEIPGTYRAVFGFHISEDKVFVVYSNKFELRETN